MIALLIAASLVEIAFAGAVALPDLYEEVTKKADRVVFRDATDPHLSATETLAPEHWVVTHNRAFGVFCAITLVWFDVRLVRLKAGPFAIAVRSRRPLVFGPIRRPPGPFRVAVSGLGRPTVLALNCPVGVLAEEARGALTDSSRTRLIKVLLEGPTAEARRRAAQLLGWLGPFEKDTKATLLWAANHDKFPIVRRAAREALKRFR